MSVVIRPPTEADVVRLFRQDGRAFGIHYPPDAFEQRRGILELDRFLVAFDGDDLIGATGIYSKQLFLPGGASIPAAGVTWVSVSPTHRRRGIMRALIERQLDDVHHAGEPAAILTASEGSIYGRFGYGVATLIRGIEIDLARARLRSDVNVSGRCRYVYDDEARRVLPPVHEAWCRAQPGTVDRRDAWWDFLFLDVPDWRLGYSARFDVVHETDDGAIDGYVTYRIGGQALSGKRSAKIVDYAALTPDAHTALWAFLLGLDLIPKLESYRIPFDDPVPWLLDDRRDLVTTEVADHLWLRVLDVARLLGSRTYSTDDRLVLEVTDRTRPHVAGRFLLDASTTGATCTPTDREPDLTVESADLASIVLGGFRANDLALAGRIVEHAPGAVRRANACFATQRLPYLHTDF